MKPEDRFDDFKNVYTWMSVGIEFAIIVLFFTFLGKYLDKFQDTYPGFMIMGFFLGFAVEMNIILRRAGVIKSKKDKNDKSLNNKDDKKS
jgi:F0F1-type ATP synthase assembly protein I